jgi:hypothetical protein
MGRNYPAGAARDAPDRKTPRESSSMKLRYILIPGAAIVAVCWLSTTPAFRHDTPDKKYAAAALMAVIVIIVLSLPGIVAKLRAPKQEGGTAGFSYLSGRR